MLLTKNCSTERLVKAKLRARKHSVSGLLKVWKNSFRSTPTTSLFRMFALIAKRKWVICNSPMLFWSASCWTIIRNAARNLWRRIMPTALKNSLGAWLKTSLWLHTTSKLTTKTCWKLPKKRLVCSLHNMAWTMFPTIMWRTMPRKSWRNVRMWMV